MNAARLGRKNISNLAANALSFEVRTHADVERIIRRGISLTSGIFLNRPGRESREANSACVAANCFRLSNRCEAALDPSITRCSLVWTMTACAAS